MSKSGVRAFLIKELKEVWPPTLYFAVSFNLLVLTINLILADYLRSFASFMVATATALVVGKAVLVANALPLLRRFDVAPHDSTHPVQNHLLLGGGFSCAVSGKARRIPFRRRNLRWNLRVCDDSLHLAPLFRYTDLDLRSLSDLHLG